MAKLLNNSAPDARGRCASVVAAAGTGSRMAGLEAKQFLPLGRRPMLAWSVDTLLGHPAIGKVVLATAPEWIERTRAMLPKSDRLEVIAGGAHRTDTVRAGLEALAGWAPDKVLIHDAARPGLSAGVIDEVLAALDVAEAACPALPMVDAIKERAADGALQSVPRERLWRMQTPQAFRFPLILEAYRGAAGGHVDDLALVEATGARVALTPGRAELMKVTYAEDMALAEKLLGGARMRVGMGFDVHGFEPGDHVTLCGVEVPHTAKLKGHSDADAAWHALTDAILGALALGDIGDHFPPSDPQWKGVASIVFLEHAVRLAIAQGYSVANADITVICEAPKIAPHREAMRIRTAEAMGIDAGRVSVKATTTERLGFTGRKEGLAAQAVVMLEG